jgi:hypothetical protein
MPGNARGRKNDSLAEPKLAEGERRLALRLRSGLILPESGFAMSERSTQASRMAGRQGFEPRYRGPEPERKD